MPLTAPPPTSLTSRGPRYRRDLCPGVLRPWPADDGALVRIRLVGGRIRPVSLAALGAIATAYGDGDLHLTGRANVQLRGLPLVGDGDQMSVPDEVVAAFETAGVLPSRRHELARNVMVSPQSGLAGGRADLRPVADELDRLLLADPVLGDLPGRFLFVLDDGRGDLLDRTVDLGLVALDASSAQLRLGSSHWGPVLSLGSAAAALVGLARTFLEVRGDDDTAAWHVDELAVPLDGSRPRDPRTVVRSAPPPYGAVPGGTHVPAPDGVLDRDLLVELLDRAAQSETLVVTPWRGVLVPDPTLAPALGVDS